MEIIDRISVRTLVEFVLRYGDIESGFSGGIRANLRALEGTRLHQKLQKEAMAKKGMEYQKEVPLSTEVEFPFGTVLVEGRADGIFRSEDGCRAIDEIKSTGYPLEDITLDTFPLHMAQAKCYGHIFLLDHPEEDQILIRISYVHVETEETRFLEQRFDRKELASFFDHVMALYRPWLEWKTDFDQIRTKSIEALEFPFDSFRPGQRTMAAYVYRTIDRKEKIFLQAPTGIGKTLSTLYPSLKSMGEGKCEKIFYLTAKNVTRQAARQAVELLRDHSALRLKTVVLTARDKICFLEKRDCRPAVCPYARGHFDRVNDTALKTLEQYDLLDEELIRKVAEEARVCPFELSLDLATWSDLVICDYNYAFDPSASLKRFFAEGSSPYVLLVDEAHNLVDRARDMFSAELLKKEVLDRKKDQDKKSRFAKRISQVNQLFLEAGRQLKEEIISGEERILPLSRLGDEFESKFYYSLVRLSETMGETLEKMSPGQRTEQEGFLEAYFHILSVIRTWDHLDEGYTCFFEKGREGLSFHLACIDPSRQLSECLRTVRSSIFFSATLSPVDYYKRLLGGEGEDPAVAFPSPFPPENRRVLIAPVRVTYQNRTESIGAICRLIYETIRAKRGHYLVFFPSFAYLEQVSEAFGSLYPEEQLLLQQREMDEEAREAFMEILQDLSAPVTGFCVLGGMFSEGIDLMGDALIGAVVVTVGLPQIGLMRNLIRDHLNTMEDEQVRGHGFEYAYTYPGLCKVLQAAGRVHRSETDRGIILLIDERFAQPRYRRLFPSEWEDIRLVGPDQIRQDLEEFWKGSPETASPAND